MWAKLKRLFGSDTSADMLSALLAHPANRDELIGMKPVEIPSPDKIKNDSAKMVKYSTSSDYKVFVDEVWGRVIVNLDRILADNTTDENRRYYCGRVKEALDLLRVSYVAREFINQYAKQQPDSLRQDQYKKQG